MKTGKIVQVMGPVVDVEFEDNDLPFIKDALEVDNGENAVSWKLHSTSAIHSTLYYVSCQ